nr:hypothetical protein OG781_02670 [Streptomyces sp. NBC_00830]
MSRNHSWGRSTDAGTAGAFPHRACGPIARLRHDGEVSRQTMAD